VLAVDGRRVIRLTQPDERPVWVNPAHIVTMRWNDAGGTYLTILDGNSRRVRETPDQIEELMTELLIRRSTEHSQGITRGIAAEVLEEPDR
jgi:uncharacterized protein YlzI (FlbEa/FlbD family)